MYKNIPQNGTPMICLSYDACCLYDIRPINNYYRLPEKYLRSVNVTSRSSCFCKVQNESWNLQDYIIYSNWPTINYNIIRNVSFIKEKLPNSACKLGLLSGNQNPTWRCTPYYRLVSIIQTKTPFLLGLMMQSANVGWLRYALVVKKRKKSEPRRGRNLRTLCINSVIQILIFRPFRKKMSAVWNYPHIRPFYPIRTLYFSYNLEKYEICLNYFWLKKKQQSSV